MLTQNISTRRTVQASTPYKGGGSIGSGLQHPFSTKAYGKPLQVAIQKSEDWMSALPLKVRNALNTNEANKHAKLALTNFASHHHAKVSFDNKVANEDYVPTSCNVNTNADKVSKAARNTAEWRSINTDASERREQAINILKPIATNCAALEIMIKHISFMHATCDALGNAASGIAAFHNILRGTPGYHVLVTHFFANYKNSLEDLFNIPVYKWTEAYEAANSITLPDVIYNGRSFLTSIAKEKEEDVKAAKAAGTTSPFLTLTAERELAEEQKKQQELTTPAQPRRPGSTTTAAAVTGSNPRPDAAIEGDSPAVDPFATADDAAAAAAVAEIEETLAAEDALVRDNQAKAAEIAIEAAAVEAINNGALPPSVMVDVNNDGDNNDGDDEESEEEDDIAEDDSDDDSHFSQIAAKKIHFDPLPLRGGGDGEDDVLDLVADPECSIPPVMDGSVSSRGPMNKCVKILAIYFSTGIINPIKFFLDQVSLNAALARKMKATKTVKKEKVAAETIDLLQQEVPQDISLITAIISEQVEARFAAEKEAQAKSKFKQDAAAAKKRKLKTEAEGKATAAKKQRNSGGNPQSNQPKKEGSGGKTHQQKKKSHLAASTKKNGGGGKGGKGKKHSHQSGRNSKQNKSGKGKKRSVKN